MDTEARLKAAQKLADALGQPVTVRTRDGPKHEPMDDNEVKKIFRVLCQTRDLALVHQLVQQLPDSPFAGRTRTTPEYYRRLKETIPRHLPTSMAVDDALWILGWAARLMKYEASVRSGGTARGRQGGRR
ncbi:MAG: hypothetical protein HY690_18770 [Chloroflexi bacterium]|nr:hypothetical protein [Chloroflexota bacterium]